MVVGTAGVPVALGETRDYELIFSQLEAAGVQVYFPVTQYQEFPVAQSLGLETDFLPPPFGTADPAVYEAMRAHGIKLAINADFLYDLNEPFPPTAHDPLSALITAAGRDLIYGVYGPDEPAFNGIDPTVSQKLYEHVKTIDVTLPVIQVHAMQIPGGRDGYLADVLSHAQWADVVGFDVYAVGESIGAMSPYSNGQLVPPADAVRDYMTWLAGNLPAKAHIVVLQGFSQADLYSPQTLAQFDPDLISALRGPTAQEMRDMLAATEGADAVFWWGQSHLKDTTSEIWQNLLAETGAWVETHGNQEIAVIVGTTADDTLFGSATSDRLVGSLGNDLLIGSDGNDVLVGGDGDDTMRSGDGDDTYYVDSSSGDIVDESGSDGVDEVRTALNSYRLAGSNVIGAVENLTGIGLTGQSLVGNGAANIIVGSWGSDTLDGGGNSDTMRGRGGDDTYIVDEIGDVVSEVGGAGVDEIRTELRIYSLTNANVRGDVENLTGLATTGQLLFGNHASNQITGGAGNDTLDGGPEADMLCGGAGDDVYLVDMIDTVDERLGSGIDEIRSSDEYYSLAAANVLGDIETLRGVAQTRQYLVGGHNANSIHSGMGDDVLDGGAGADTLRACAGDDVYLVDNVGDVVIEAAGEGSDTVWATVTFTLGLNVENLILKGSANINGFGNKADNNISGTIGNNILDGGGGNDALVGGDGADLYFVDSAGDMILESSADPAQIDTVRASVSFALSANLENLMLTGSAAIDGAGNEMANQIFGNSGANWLIGGLGADVMSGGSGDDLYVVDNASDVVIEAAGAGALDQVLTSVNYALKAGVQVELFATSTMTGTGTINLTGNGFNQQILGNAGANIINGGGGADSMYGGAGNDTYFADNVADVIFEASTGGTADSVATSVSYALSSSAYIEKLSTTASAGTAAINLTGNGIAQTITGNAGVNKIDGKGGADTMNGGDGNDIYVVDNASDFVNENIAGPNGVDTIQSSITFNLANTARVLGSVENLTLLGSGNTRGTGNALNNVITGNTGANSISGGNGNDTFVGGGDADVLNGGTGTDRASYSTAAGGVVANLTSPSINTGDAKGDTYVSIENLSGSNFNDVLYGSNGVNAISGGNSNDILIGYGGNDTLIGGVGADRFDFRSTMSATTNVDKISDFNVADDTMRLENAIFTALTVVGTLASGAFASNSTGLAGDGNDSIIYEKDTGELYYDANGTGAGGGIHFATLTANLSLNNADFLVI